MNKIYLHIGPPKTGTTSLQYWLNGENFNNYSYEGVIQPRENDSTALSNLLSGKISNHQKSCLIEKIQDKIKHKSLIISEELFTVIGDRLEWENSMKILLEVLHNFNPTIIICLREPHAAIRSYYQEIYHRLSPPLQKNVNMFAKSDWCFPYDYNELANSLLKIGFADIKFISFDRLVSGEYKFNEIFEGNDNRKIILKRENVSKKIGSKRTSNNKLSVKAKVRLLLPESLLTLLRNHGISQRFPDIRYFKRFSKDELEVSLEKRFSENYWYNIEMIANNNMKLNNDETLDF